jgi:hypothetical protein
MMWIIFGSLVLVIAALYIGGFVLRLFDSAWLAAKMPALFPLLFHRVDPAWQIWHLAVWSVILPIVGVLILRHNPYALGVLFAIAMWEVYLGATFYFDIGDVKQACVHMILHSVIAGVILSHFLRGWW